ncbi:hypothetical protein [Pseudomonas aeruginosa]|uniref:hypothetical protein n=1 Tax=Pseudomonas aeruginosa TaxID=287 RepID=UPI003F83FC94
MLILGTDLPHSLQEEAKRLYVHRYTGDHKPFWATRPMPNGNAYPVQFADDADWLANTRFEVTKRGAFSRRVVHCQSNPTWPFNPELRTKSA